jgi:hypothetical protein
MRFLLTSITGIIMAIIAFKNAEGFSEIFASLFILPLFILGFWKRI